MADELFERIPRLRVMICRQYRYRLFPSRAGSHYIYIRFPHGRAPPPPRPSQAQQAVDAWTEYLKDIPPADLLRSVEAPNPDTGDPVEQGVLILYYTVDQLARKSQRTVTHCGQPLLAYIDANSVRKHVQPWQQILEFFARTQHPQAWKCPAYQFTARQQQKWARLWQLVQHPEPQPELQDVDKALATTRTSTRARCYPPILSRVIKIARFFVVEKALWLDPAAMQISADDELKDLDEGYASGSTASSPAPSSIELDSSEGGFRLYPEFSHDRDRAVDYRPERPSREASSEQSSEGFGIPVHLPVGRPHVPGPVKAHGAAVPSARQPRPDADVARLAHGTNELLYKELRFTIGDFRGFIYGLVETTRELLDQLLLGAADQPPPAILWGRLYDNPVKGKAGWSFICNSRITIVALVTAYHKGFYASNNVKIIHRYVPREIGELIIYYLWLSPAPREPPSTQERALLWGPNPGTRRVWSSDWFREVFKQETQSRLTKKKPVYLAAYRDIAISISRRFLRASSQFPQSADERHQQEPAITDPDNKAAMDDE
ncbi:hypothetical protein HFD88_000032 [Aspergillus terreus]|nr:hypothetical protein HFD88_000032 [Aspergillus terreus]